MAAGTLGIMEIEPGTVLEVITASGDVARMRATTGPMRGRDFPVVWVCTEQEYKRLPKTAGPPQQGIPWPLDAVRRTLEEAR